MPFYVHWIDPGGFYSWGCSILGEDDNDIDTNHNQRPRYE